MKKLCNILMFSILTINLLAQEFEVPKNYVLKQKEDYPKYESEVLKGIDWLLQTPINSQPEKRKEINAFIVVWLTGSPDVSLEINSKIVNFMNPNPELLIIFMCGWTKYALETNDNNKITGNLKGIEAVIEFYLKNRENLKKDKKVEHYIKLKEKGELGKFITKNA